LLNFINLKFLILVNLIFIFKIKLIEKDLPNFKTEKSKNVISPTFQRGRQPKTEDV